MNRDAPTRFLLDTNILLRVARGDGAFIAELESRFALFTGNNRAYVSYVSIGEIEVIATVGNWGAARWRVLIQYVQSLQIVPLDSRAILDGYVRVDTYNRNVGRDMGSKNDLWIAATALVYDAVLLTTDKDFDHLTQIGVQVQRLTV